MEINFRRTLESLGVHDHHLQKEIWSKVGEWSLHHEYERGKIDSKFFFESLKKHLNLKNAEQLENSWNNLIVGPLPGAEKIFTQFKGKVPICALSNTNECHYNYQMAKFPILKEFDQFFTSFELGHRKPDAEIFLKAAEQMNVKPQNILFIDDLLPNIEAAKKLGLHSFQTINSPEKTIQILSEHL